MALKLKVPWSRELIEVGFHREIEKIRTFANSHVSTDGSDVLVDNFFGKNNRVLDVSRYRICADGHCVRHNDISGRKLKLELSRQRIGSIVLLLESPHKDEYTDEDRIYCINQPQAPASGNSGTKIDECLCNLITKITQDPGNAELDVSRHIVHGSHVIISNPIPFQTSLHAVHHGEPLEDSDDYLWATLRDFVWRTLWREQRIRRHFHARLKRYNPSLIINACTGDPKKSGTLKSSVNRFVLEKLPSVTLYSVSHPVSWRHQGNIAPKRINPPANQNADNPQQ